MTTESHQCVPNICCEISKPSALCTLCPICDDHFASDANSVASQLHGIPHTVCCQSTDVHIITDTEEFDDGSVNIVTTVTARHFGCCEHA